MCCAAAAATQEARRLWAWGPPYHRDTTRPAHLQEGPIERVRMSGLAALRIVQHCKGAHPTTVTGQLLGLDVAEVLEITDAFPFPAADAQEEDDGADYQLNMMRCLRCVPPALMFWQMDTFSARVSALRARAAHTDRILVDFQFIVCVFLQILSTSCSCARKRLHSDCSMEQGSRPAGRTTWITIQRAGISRRVTAGGRRRSL